MLCRTLLLTVGVCLLVPPQSATAQGGGSTPPDAWAAQVLKPCRDRAAALRASDEVLARELRETAQSREQSSFVRREGTARVRAAVGHRTEVLARINALVLGRKARFRDRRDTSASIGHDSFDALSGRLFAATDPCELEAVEATLLFAVFGVPFDPTSAAHIGPDREFALLDARMHKSFGGGQSRPVVFERARPPNPADAFAYLESVVQAAVHEDRDMPRSASARSDEEHRIAEFLELSRLAAEPMRIETYLHAQVDEVEGAVGTPVSDGAIQILIEQAERALYRDVPAMRRLQHTMPDVIVRDLEPVLDRWFQKTALPAIHESLARDPFAAYWFFIQSGMTIAPDMVYADSHVELRDVPSLNALEGLPFALALARARDLRIPARYLDRYSELETAFTEPLSRDDVRASIEMAPGTPEVRATLRQLLLPSGDSDPVTSIALYSRVVRDASKIRGRVDWTVLGAALDVLHRAKRDRLTRLIERIVAADLVRDARLAGYLTTAGALLIELERRQASERRFQQRTSGALVGWILSQFLIAGGVPITLWAPGGVTGPAFADLVDELTPKNGDSGNTYRGKHGTELRLVHDGREYHDTLVEIIDNARDFINVASFDWKTDAGGREIAYRLMAKKLGIDRAQYAQFLTGFRRGLPLDPAQAAPVPFYDIPTTRMKDLLVTFAIMNSEHPEVARARGEARASGASLACDTVKTCGDLRGLLERTGERYDRRRSSPDYDRAWHAYRQIESLFAERPPEIRSVHPRRALRDYITDPTALRRFIRRFGLKRADQRAEPFAINIVADGKQSLSNVRVGERSGQFPYFFSDPIRDIYFALMEFDIRAVLWKGPLEFPWHAGPVPLPGRKILGRIPMPFVPYPWIERVPGFGWAGPISSLVLQYLIASDPRVFWAMISHTKSWSSETMALESGLGMGSKYVNEHDAYKTWHDTGIAATGSFVADVNDHFVQVFNQARVNNAGVPSSRGVKVPRLHYEDFQPDRSDGPADADNERRAGGAGRTERFDGRTWLLTTHPELGDSNYRGVFMAALAAARRSIYIENVFFSDPLVARMLMHKAREFRGRVSCAGLTDHDCAQRKRDAVQIHLVLPDSSDKPVVDAVGTADFHEMLHLGIKLYRWRPSAGWSASSMLHTKAWLIDYDPDAGGLTYVGAANATQRSHLSDNEAGILSTSPALARDVYDRLFRPDIDLDSHLEVGLNFHVIRSSNPAVRASRWLRRVLVDLLWFM